MKWFALYLLVLSSFSSHAEVKPYSLQTDILCQQQYANPWIEVGIAPLQEGGHFAVILQHDENTKKTVAITEMYVMATFRTNSEWLYESVKEDFILTLYTGMGLGDLEIKNSKLRESLFPFMICSPGGSITYDRSTKPLPRISVGN